MVELTVEDVKVTICTIIKHGRYGDINKHFCLSLVGKAVFISNFV